MKERQISLIIKRRETQVDFYLHLLPHCVGRKGIVEETDSLISGQIYFSEDGYSDCGSNFAS